MRAKKSRVANLGRIGGILASCSAGCRTVAKFRRAVIDRGERMSSGKRRCWHIYVVNSQPGNTILTIFVRCCSNPRPPVVGCRVCVAATSLFSITANKLRTKFSGIARASVNHLKAPVLLSQGECRRLKAADRRRPQCMKTKKASH